MESGSPALFDESGIAAKAEGRDSNDYKITMAEIVMAILMISCSRN